MSVGPTLGVRGSVENLPDIRFAFDGPGALDSYALTNAIAYDVGAGAVRGRSRTWVGPRQLRVHARRRRPDHERPRRRQTLLRRGRWRHSDRPDRDSRSRPSSAGTSSANRSNTASSRPHQPARNGELLMSALIRRLAGGGVRRRGTPRPSRAEAAARVAGAIDGGPARGRRRAVETSRTAPDRHPNPAIRPASHEPGPSPDRRRRAPVQSGALSPVALVQACLAQIDARPELNAFITRLDAQALADAERCERRDSRRTLPRPAPRHSDLASRIWSTSPA